MRVKFYPLTVSDLNKAIACYNRQRPGFGESFRTEVYAAIDRLCLSPARNAIVENGIRRCLVHRFPYSILYRIVDDSSIRVLVIRHHRRHERHGLGRR